jgi:serine/threonine protein kinase
MSRSTVKLKNSDLLGNRYRILSIIGEGGMGSVYLAEDIRLKGKRWAVKESYRSSESIQEFIDEAEMLIHLNHPNLPKIIDYFPPDDAGYSYLVMDYIQGQTLMKIFEDKVRNLSFRRVLSYSIQLCQLFNYLHHHKPRPIIYRDLKPSNVMIDEADQVRLIDFGIARNYIIGQQADTVPMGTIGFAAPEQFEELQTDHRTDLYNLGAMMYFLLSNGHYYYLTQKPISYFRDDLPEGFADTLDQLLKTNPEERIQSALEVEAKLRSYEGSQGDDNNETAIVIQPYLQNKVIVIGSVYRGAGSTFAATALARTLNYYQITNAVIEYPTIEPSLYELLDGDHSLPKGYTYLAEELQADTKANVRTEWTSDFTTWYPTNPNGNQKNQWSSSNNYKLLYAIKSQVLLIDISDQWEDAGVRELCAEADEIILVADMDPYKFNRELTQQRFDYAFQLNKLGNSVHFIANKDLESQFQKDWIQSFPWSPTCRLPSFSYSDIIRAAWKGKLIQDQSDIKNRLLISSYPLLKQIVSNEYLKKFENSKKESILFKWRKKYL